ncbi:hypothetical protein GCM10022254_58780 [Actinomadura meridiana]|uniref:Uncharacterized protein n=1 Tax=Actinomadura meridiana TaxID=559626 RepID=A0ABP8CH87_9ACTN
MDTNHEERRLTALAARRFPLVARPGVIPRPLTIRIEQIESRAAQAQQGGPDAVTRAAEALNLAALLASDAGDPERARALCWRQFNQLAAATPFQASSAKLALQPLINLARLRTRGGEGRRAFQLLHTLFSAVTHRTTADLDGCTVDLSALTTSDHDHLEIRTWLWQVLLVDGTRALVRAGDWNRALQYTEQLHGIGPDLNDGRQIAILAHAIEHRRNEAFRLLHASDVSDPWDETVARCLTIFCLRLEGRQTETETAQVAEQFLTLNEDPALITAISRLGMTVLDLSQEPSGSCHSRILDRLLALGGSPGGTQAAREFLQHPAAARLPTKGQQELAEVIRVAGLDAELLPEHLHHRLSAAVDVCAMALGGRHRSASMT